jgi:MraZ protein
MAYFSGEYECTVDPKGRMILPAKVKAHLPEGFTQEIYVMRSSADPCLVIYPIPESEKLATKVLGLNEFDEDTAIIQRNFFRAGQVFELDNMGRFLITKRMLEYAGIGKDAILVGMGNRLEVWDPATYEKHLISDPKELASLLKKHLGSQGSKEN